MKFIWRLVAVFIPVIVFSGCSGDGDSGNANPSGPQSSYAVHASPLGPPPFGCNPPGAATLAVMQKLNAFWQSGVQACSCDVVTLANGCAHNGFVHPTGVGYIFYDSAFLDILDAQGSTLPADFFMAHEFGHNIQLVLGLNPPGKIRELQADCLGGFYVGFQARSGQVTQADVMSTFQFSCSIGDPFLSNWWDSSHGTCSERVSALQQGFNGYFAGNLPGEACPSP